MDGQQVPASLCYISQIHTSRPDFSIAPATLVLKSQDQISKTELMISLKFVPLLVFPFAVKGTPVSPAVQARHLGAVPGS